MSLGATVPPSLLKTLNTGLHLRTQGFHFAIPRDNVYLVFRKIKLNAEGSFEILDNNILAEN